MASNGATDASRRRALRASSAALVGLAWLALAGAGWLALACAGGSSADGRGEHARHGGALGDLAALEPGWQPERVEGATLAYRHADGSRASWLRECRAVESTPRALARALWIAIPELAIAREAGLELAGAPAWQIVGGAREGRGPLQAEAIARVTKRCEDYFLIVEPLRERGHAEAFARWWASFRDGGGAR